MDENLKNSWENFVNPESLRFHLTAASIYIAGFESLKESIVVRIKDFFSIDCDESNSQTSPEYTSNVLSLDSSPVYGSLYWLRNAGAITADDIETFNRVKACRNTLSHELLFTLSSKGLPDNFEERFIEMVALLRKIEVWWIKNIDIPTNPRFDCREIDEKDIAPGRVLIIQMLLDIALGDASRSGFYYKEFKEKNNKSSHSEM